MSFPRAEFGEVSNDFRNLRVSNPASNAPVRPTYTAGVAAAAAPARTRAVAPPAYTAGVAAPARVRPAAPPAYTAGVAAPARTRAAAAVVPAPTRARAAPPAYTAGVAPARAPPARARVVAAAAPAPVYTAGVEEYAAGEEDEYTAGVEEEDEYTAGVGEDEEYTAGLTPACNCRTCVLFQSVSS